MSALEVVLLIAGFTVTGLVVAAMILIVPRGAVPVEAGGRDLAASDLDAAAAADRPEVVTAGA